MSKLDEIKADAGNEWEDYEGDRDLEIYKARQNIPWLLARVDGLSINALAFLRHAHADHGDSFDWIEVERAQKEIELLNE